MRHEPKNEGMNETLNERYKSGQMVKLSLVAEWPNGEVA